MTQEIQKIERSIRERSLVDSPLLNFWLNLFLINWITGGIMSLVLYFQRIGRVDKFIIRRRDFYQAVIDFTDKYARENNKYEDIKMALTDLQNFYNEVFLLKAKEIKGGLSFFLTIVTLGIWAIIVQYKMNKAWDELQNYEQEFVDKLNAIWIKLELIKYPINFKTNPDKKRNFWIQILLSIVTLGIWGLVWAYKIHVDPDDLYKEFHSVEDTILQTIKQ